jgi:hypothetical protein
LGVKKNISDNCEMKFKWKKNEFLGFRTTVITNASQRMSKQKIISARRHMFRRPSGPGTVTFSQQTPFVSSHHLKSEL